MEARKIIDAHAHIFPDKIAGKATESIGEYYGVPITGSGTVEGLLKSGSRINVYKYIVHSTATKVEQVSQINDFIAEAQANNGSFIGFGTLHPEMENTDSEVDRIISLGLKGIKLHPEFQNFNIDDKGMLKIYKAVEGRLPILMHMGDEWRTSSSPKRLAKILDIFPGLTVIAAHLGGYSMWNESMEYLLGKNVYFDTSSTLQKLEKEKALHIIREHGANKVIFGTDYPMWNHKDEIERFNTLGLDEEESELILWKNVYRLLKL